MMVKKKLPIWLESPCGILWIFLNVWWLLFSLKSLCKSLEKSYSKASFTSLIFYSKFNLVSKVVLFNILIKKLIWRSYYNTSDDMLITYLNEKILSTIIFSHIFVGYESIFFNLNLLNTQLIFLLLKLILKTFFWRIEGKQFILVVFGYY